MLLFLRIFQKICCWFAIEKKKEQDDMIFINTEMMQKAQLTPEYRPSLSGCDDAAFIVCMLCYTSVARCQGRQVHRDSGLERRHPVFSLYSRETEECSLFIFIQMKLELTASAIHCNKWFFKSESRFFSPPSLL